MSKYTLIIGNPMSGFSHLGPFDCMDEAGIYGEGHFPTTEFWVAELVDPTEYAAELKAAKEWVMDIDTNDVGALPGE